MLRVSETLSAPAKPAFVSSGWQCFVRACLACQHLHRLIFFSQPNDFCFAFILYHPPPGSAGDDVGMVLSPQAFFNLNQHADIFNHANIHFWEYAQHGYDALGFISCTGGAAHIVYSLQHILERDALAYKKHS